MIVFNQVYKYLLKEGSDYKLIIKQRVILFSRLEI